MPVEDRTGTCATCDLPIYRQPNRLPDRPDKWFHRRDPNIYDFREEPWMKNPHEPTPKEGTPA
jgi:hypothetical protein